MGLLVGESRADRGASSTDVPGGPTDDPVIVPRDPADQEPDAALVASYAESDVGTKKVVRKTGKARTSGTSTRMKSCDEDSMRHGVSSGAN